jgi:hypothetical protein
VHTPAGKLDHFPGHISGQLLELGLWQTLVHKIEQVLVHMPVPRIVRVLENIQLLERKQALMRF